MGMSGIGGLLLAAGVAILGVLLSSILPNLTPLQQQLLWAATVILILFGLGMALWPSRGKERVASMGDNYNNSGNNFGHMGPVNIGNPKLAFSPEVGREMLGRLTEKKPVKLLTVGSQSDQQIGNQFHQFLLDSGFEVSRITAGVVGSPPSQKIEIGNDASYYLVTIAPSA